MVDLGIGCRSRPNALPSSWPTSNGASGPAERWPSTGIVAVASDPSQVQPHPAFPLRQRTRQPPHVARHGDARRYRRRPLVAVTRACSRAHGDYRRMMRHAGKRRTGGRDGRGQLSVTALAEFSEWMLSVMLEEVRFAQASFALRDPRAALSAAPARARLRRERRGSRRRDPAFRPDRPRRRGRGPENVGAHGPQCPVTPGSRRLPDVGDPERPRADRFPAPTPRPAVPQLFAKAPAEPLRLRASSNGPTDASATA